MVKNGKVRRLLLLLCLTLLLTACGKPSTLITGVVREHATGEPIGAVEITLGEYSTRSDLDGHYSFEQVSAGSYTLTASSPDHERYDQQIVLKKGQHVSNDILLKCKTTDAVSVPEQAPKTEEVPETATRIPSAEVHETQDTRSLDTSEYAANAFNEAPIAVISVSTVRSGAVGIVGFSACGSSDPDGRIETYHWDFGDGEDGTGELLIHTFAREGTYHVTLTISDNMGTTAQDSVTVMVSAPSAPISGKIIKPEDHKGLQPAIDAATPGDIILLRSEEYDAWDDAWGVAGRYTLVITKSITLRGAGIDNTVLTARGSPKITIRAEEAPIEVTIEDLTISGGRDYNYEFDIRVEGEVNLTFNRVKVWNTDGISLKGAVNLLATASVINSGIQADQARTLAFKECALSEKSIYVGANNGCTCLYVEGSQLMTACVRLGECSTALLSNCEFSGEQHYGVVSMHDNAYAKLVDCSFSGDSEPLSISGESSVLIEGCKFTGNDQEGSSALSISGGASVEIVGSQFSRYSDAIHIYSSPGNSRVVVRDSSVTENMHAGIYLYNGQITIANCTISNNGTAGVLLEGCGRAILIGNHIENNSDWGVLVRGSAIALGWENTVSGSKRDLFGVTDHLLQQKTPENKPTINVPEDTPTIQEAIYKASTGATIFLSAGEYEAQKLGIYKPLTLKGEDGATVMAEVVILDGAGDVQLQNLSIVGSDGEGTGLTVGYYNSVDINSCTITGFYMGVALLEAAHAYFFNCSLHNNCGGALECKQGSLRMFKCTIRANVDFYTHTAIFLRDSFSTIEECVIEKNAGTAVEIEGGRTDLGACIIRDNEDNALCVGGGLVCIKSSQILGNTEAGVADMGSISLSIEDCEIAFNSYGVQLDAYEHGEVYTEEVLGFGNNIHDNSRADLSPAPDQYPWPSGFGSGS